MTVLAGGGGGDGANPRVPKMSPLIINADADSVPKRHNTLYSFLL